MTVTRRGTRHHFTCATPEEMAWVLRLDARKWGEE